MSPLARTLFDTAVDVDELLLRDSGARATSASRARSSAGPFRPADEVRADSHFAPDIICRSFARYSGYVVSAAAPSPLPPAARPRRAYCVRNGFCPGRKPGTSCLSRGTSLGRLAVVQPVGIAAIHDDEFLAVDHWFR